MRSRLVLSQDHVSDVLSDVHMNITNAVDEAPTMLLEYLEQELSPDHTMATEDMLRMIQEWQDTVKSAPCDICNEPWFDDLIPVTYAQRPQYVCGTCYDTHIGK